jgi:hypothetical protein
VNYDLLKLLDWIRADTDNYPADLAALPAAEGQLATLSDQLPNQLLICLVGSPGYPVYHPLG